MNKITTISVIAVSALGTALLFGTKNEKQLEAKSNELKASTTLLVKEKKAFYGDLHLHTTQSFDAYSSGTRIGPEEAYRFAKGEPVEFFGEKIKRNFPLDFLAVTDHSENIGVLTQLNDTTSLLSKSEIGKKFKAAGNDRTPTGKYFFMSDYSAEAPGFDNKAVTRSAWQRQIDAANNSYQPGKFTSFIAYEWTSAPDRQNLHRVVVFKDAKPTDRPFSSIDSQDPQDLWKYLDNLRKNGIEGIAIPHNSNASNGLMFDWNDRSGKPIDQAYAQDRALNEPIAEVTQSKGTSETHPEFSPTDEFANYELVDFMSPRVDSVRKTSGAYLRDAFGRGLIIKEKTGVNPFKYGLVGASDLHGGLTISEEAGYEGTIEPINPNPKATLVGEKLPSRAFYTSGSITAVWAEENTREAIFAAFKRKETFATTGTKLTIRFFSGWDLGKDLAEKRDWNTAYLKGVPMGGDLPAKPAQKKAPIFLAYALKDPNGANLDRLQIVKVWVKGGKQLEKIFEAALADGRKPDAGGKVKPVGNTVDTKTATYQNTIGDTELSALWTDPEFDPTLAAVYYLRVLEIPTPRWTTILAARKNLPVPSQVASTIQERGWSSPIWYSPEKK